MLGDVYEPRHMENATASLRGFLHTATTLSDESYTGKWSSDGRSPYHVDRALKAQRSEIAALMYQYVFLNLKLPMQSHAGELAD